MTSQPRPLVLRSTVVEPDARTSADGPDGAPALDTVLAAVRDAIPAAEHVAVVLAGDRERGLTVAASDDIARRLDALQRTLDEGPVIEVMSPSSREIVVTDDASPDRWPEFAPRARALGMTAAVAIRLCWGGRVVGALGIYATRATGIRPHTVALAEKVATHTAATAVLADKVRQLEQAMLTRQQIGQAVGILMERYDLDPDSAFSYLRRVSQNHNVKIRLLADELATTGHMADEPPRKA